VGLCGPPPSFIAACGIHQVVLMPWWTIANRWSPAPSRWSKMTVPWGARVGAAAPSSRVGISNVVCCAQKPLRRTWTPHNTLHCAPHGTAAAQRVEFKRTHKFGYISLQFGYPPCERGRGYPRNVRHSVTSSISVGISCNVAT
jgi:hypothetical protein